jgi:hypothetical protein
VNRENIFSNRNAVVADVMRDRQKQKGRNRVAVGDVGGR